MTASKFIKFDDDSYKISFSSSKKPFVTNWGRVGCFLTSFARNKISSFLESRFEDVVWVHTDGFVLTKELITDKQFENELHAIKYEGHHPNISISNMRPSGMKDFII